jgi:hypothetical protein
MFPAPIANVTDLQRACVAWLADSSLRLDDLKAGLASAADGLARRAGRAPLLPPFGDTSASTEAEAAARALGERLHATLLTAISRAVSTAHPLYVVYSRRVVENLRLRVTRALHAALPAQSAGSDADTSEGGSVALEEFWLRLAGGPEGEGVDKTVIASVPAACAEDVERAAGVVARLVRHNHAVHEPRYRALQADERRAAASAARDAAAAAVAAVAAAVARGDADGAAAAAVSAGQLVVEAAAAAKAAGSANTGNAAQPMPQAACPS